MPNELELDRFFWNAFSTKPEFQKYLLAKSKFASRSFELKVDELWHHRWYKDPVTRLESETDITLTFKEALSGHLYAIHIENKTERRRWEKNQAENYRIRALNRMAKWKHDGWEVALMAPQKHIDTHPYEASQFDFTISYEEVGAFVPEFALVCEAGVGGLVSQSRSTCRTAMEPQVRWTHVKRRNMGHGVQFLHEKHPNECIAFLEGYGWRDGNLATATLLEDRPARISSEDWPGIERLAQEAVFAFLADEAVQAGGFRLGPIFIIFNG